MKKGHALVMLLIVALVLFALLVDVLSPVTPIRAVQMIGKWLFACLLALSFVAFLLPVRDVGLAPRICRRRRPLSAGPPVRLIVLLCILLC